MAATERVQHLRMARFEAQHAMGAEPPVFERLSLLNVIATEPRPSLYQPHSGNADSRIQARLSLTRKSGP